MTLLSVSTPDCRPGAVGEDVLAHRARLPELKHGLGLYHFEGRTWRGWHHHVTLVTVAYLSRCTGTASSMVSTGAASHLAAPVGLLGLLGRKESVRASGKEQVVRPSTFSEQAPYPQRYLPFSSEVAAHG